MSKTKPSLVRLFDMYRLFTSENIHLKSEALHALTYYVDQIDTTELSQEEIEARFNDGLNVLTKIKGVTS